MKKIGALLLALGLLCGGLSVHAANGDGIGTVYSTDILACINGRPVPYDRLRTWEKGRGRWNHKRPH